MRIVGRGVLGQARAGPASRSTAAVAGQPVATGEQAAQGQGDRRRSAAPEAGPPGSASAPDRAPPRGRRARARRRWHCGPSGTSSVSARCRLSAERAALCPLAVCAQTDRGIEAGRMRRARHGLREGVGREWRARAPCGSARRPKASSSWLGSSGARSAPPTPGPSASTRSSICTNRPESGRVVQAVLAVVWTRISQPLPRRAPVTSGVPSDERGHGGRQRGRGRAPPAPGG